MDAELSTIPFNLYAIYFIYSFVGLSFVSIEDNVVRPVDSDFRERGTNSSKEKYS